MEINDPALNLNKKDEKKINGFLRYFKQGLITGSGIIVGFLLALLFMEIWQKLF